MALFDDATFDPEQWLREDKAQTRQYLQIPLVKSYTTDGGGWVVEGVASCEESDADAERVLQKGMDTTPLLSVGHFNWDHHDDRGPGYLIGVPQEVLIAPADNFKEQLGKSINGPAFYVRGELWNHPLKPIAKQVWEHLQAMQELNRPRGLGFSVQGSIIERDRLNPKIITKSVCRQLAITHQPKQSYTFAQIAKSFANDANLQQSMTTGSAAALMRENFGQRMTDLLFGECKHNCLDGQGKFRQGVRSAVQHLTLCKGYDLGDVRGGLETLIKSYITRRECD